MSLINSQLRVAWHNIKSRLKLIALACNLGRPLPHVYLPASTADGTNGTSFDLGTVSNEQAWLQLEQTHKQITEVQSLNNQLLELGFSSTLPAELAVDLAHSPELRKKAKEKLKGERLNKLAKDIHATVVSHAKAIAELIPIPEGENTDCERISRWRIERIAPLLLACELIMLNEQRAYSLPIFSEIRSKAFDVRDWRDQVATAYEGIATHLQEQRPHGPKPENQKLFLYPIVNDTDCGIWIGNEYGIGYGPCMSFYLKLTDRLCPLTLTTRGVEIISSVAFRHSCGLWPVKKTSGILSCYSTTKADEHAEKRLNNYLPELGEIYIMGDAHEWATIASKAEQSGKDQLAQEASANEWQRLLSTTMPSQQ